MLRIYEKGAPLSFPEDDLMMVMTSPKLTRWHRFKIWLRSWF